MLASFVAGELCRKGDSAVVTLGNTPNTDIPCSNLEGTRFVHIQVKTFVLAIRHAALELRLRKTLEIIFSGFLLEYQNHAPIQVLNTR